jgi:hypothetical protein
MAQQHREHFGYVGNVVDHQCRFAYTGLNPCCFGIGRQINRLVRVVRQDLAETINRGVNNRSRAGRATILHAVSLSAGFVVESGINLAETSMRVYKTSRFECVKVFD